MNEIERIEIKYHVKTHYVFEDISLFTPKDIKLIFDYPKKFEEYYCEVKKDGASYKILNKQEFDNIVNGKYMGMTKAMEVDILSRMRGIVKTNIKHSSNSYILPYPKYESMFYVFSYDELKFLFYVLLMDMEMNELLRFKRKSSGKSKMIVLANEKFKDEFEAFYFPCSSFDTIKEKFITEYVPYMASNENYVKYFKKRWGVLVGVKE